MLNNGFNPCFFFFFYDNAQVSETRNMTTRSPGWHKVCKYVYTIWYQSNFYAHLTASYFMRLELGYFAHVFPF